MVKISVAINPFVTFLTIIIRLLLGLFLIQLCFSSSVHAQTEVYAQVQPETGSLNDVFRFIVTVEGASPSSGPLLSGGEDFDIQFVGPETRVSVIDGHMERATSYVYHLLPKTTGTLATPSAEVVIGGNAFETTKLKVKVSKSSPRPHDLGQIFFRQVPDKDEVYKGEQVVLSLDLYHSVPLVSAEFVELSFDNFWTLELGDEKTSQKYLKGNRFTLHRLRRSLFPLRSGDISLSEKKIRVSYREASKFPRSFGGLAPFSPGFFDRFFLGGDVKETTLSSNESQIRVKELPPLPSDFVGPQSPVLVGATSIELQYEPADIEVGKSRDIELIVRSFGNLGPLEAPELQVPRYVKVYKEKPVTKYDESNSLLRSVKTFKYSLVGIGGGEVVIPALRVDYFDPQSGKYRSTSTAPIEFNVLGPPLVSAQPELKSQEPASADGETLEVVQDPPQSVLPEETLFKRTMRSVSFRLVVYLSLCLTLLAAAMWFIFFYLHRKESLAEVSKTVAEADSLSELSRTYRLALAKAMKLEESAPSSSDAIRGSVRRFYSDDPLRERLLQVFDELDAALYSGARFSSEDAQTLLKAVKQEILALLPACYRR